MIWIRAATVGKFKEATLRIKIYRVFDQEKHVVTDTYLNVYF